MVFKLAANDTIHKRLERDRKAANPKPGMLRTFRDYARGYQKGTLTPAQQAILRGVTGNVFCDNICKMVLAAASSRVQLARFDVADNAVQEWLEEFWTLAQLSRLANQVHWATLRDGNHALALSWDNESQRVILTREKWWDGKSGTFIAYDELDNPIYAVKEWQTTEKRLRRVVWFPDHIERYIQEGNGWKPYNLDEENTAFTKWTDGSGQSIGLPVVHFRNVYMAHDASNDDLDTTYGISELDGGMLGLQDEINDVHRDITAAARFTGYQMLYATGVTPATDGNGAEKSIKVEPGAVLQNSSKDAKYGVLQAGDLSQLERVLNIKLRAVSRLTSTPLHTITGGDWPSGEALLQADKPLIRKVLAMGYVFAPTWASVAHKATMLANAFGGQTLDTDAMISTIFQAPEDWDLMTLVKIGKMMAPYVSEQEVLRQFGKTETQIKQILKEKADAAKERAALATPPGSAPGDGQQPGGGADTGQAGKGAPGGNDGSNGNKEE